MNLAFWNCIYTLTLRPVAQITVAEVSIVVPTLDIGDDFPPNP